MVPTTVAALGEESDRMAHESRVREAVASLRPIDDLMFRLMAQSRGFCEEVLRVLLEDPGLTVVECTPQSAVTNPRGRSAVLDALCELSGGGFVDVEVQRVDEGDLQRRARYYASLMTADRTGPGTPFGDVPDVCVAIVCEFDPFGAARSLYHMDRVLRETGEAGDNGLREVYVNALARDGSEVAALMRLFTEGDAYDDARFPETSSGKRRLRETEEGGIAMGGIIEELCQESKAEGKAEGTLETICRLVRDGLVSVQDAAASAGVDAGEIRRALAAQG